MMNVELGRMLGVVSLAMTVFPPQIHTDFHRTSFGMTGRDDRLDGVHLKGGLHLRKADYFPLLGLSEQKKIKQKMMERVSHILPLDS
jgi:hypothetical protein